MQSTGQGAMQSSQPVHSDAQHRVHALRGADDRVDGARVDAQRAADAPGFVDSGDGERRLCAAFRIEPDRGSSGQRGERRDDGVAAGRAAVDGLALRNRIGIGTAGRRSRTACIAAAAGRRRCGRRGTVARSAVMANHCSVSTARCDRLLDYVCRAGADRAVADSIPFALVRTGAIARKRRRADRSTRARRCRADSRSQRCAPSAGTSCWPSRCRRSASSCSIRTLRTGSSRSDFSPNGRSGIHFRYVGKDALFRWPFGRVFGAGAAFRSTGGCRPGFIGQMREEFARHDDFRLVIAPEGTRSRTEHWRSGFYHLARAAGVPVALAFIDYPPRRIGVGAYVDLSGDPPLTCAGLPRSTPTKGGHRPENQGPVSCATESTATPEARRRRTGATSGDGHGRFAARIRRFVAAASPRRLAWRIMRSIDAAPRRGFSAAPHHTGKAMP